MRGLPTTIFWVASVSREISWLYAWTAFSYELFRQSPYPFLEAVTVTVVASLVTTSIQKRGFRPVQIFTIHGVALAFFIFRDLHLLGYRDETFFSTVWLRDFLSSEPPIEMWFSLALFWGWTTVFWISGVGQARRTISYWDVCSRFDKGLAWLFVLLFIKLVLQVQAGVKFVENGYDRLVFSYFFFGLLSVALARNRSRGHKRFISGYRGIGLTVSLGGTVILCSAGLSWLFLPYLKEASRAGYRVLIDGGGPLLSVLADILLHLFGIGRNRSTPVSIPLKNREVMMLTESESSRDLGSGSELYLWILQGVLGLVLVLLICIGIWYLGRWLFSKTKRTKPDQASLHFLWVWLERWFIFLYLLVTRLLERKKAPESIRLYRALLEWGRRSGLPNRRSETPLEYGNRLKQQFQVVDRDIDLIVSSFNLYVYGQKFFDKQGLIKAQRALKRLHCPGLWPRRLKVLFFSGE